MSLNSFFFALNKCSEILKLNQEFLNKEKFYDFVIFDQNHEVPKLISFSIVKFYSRNSHIKINSFKMSGLCLRLVFIFNRKIELLYISGSECRYVSTSTNWNTAYQFYTVFRNKCSRVYKHKNMKFQNVLYEASLVESIFKGFEFGIWEKSGKFLWVLVGLQLAEVVDTHC